MSNTTPLAPGDAIRRWAMAAPKAEHFPGTARPMPDRIDYRFVNGWVDTGDLPCREAIHAIRGANDTRPDTLPEATFDNIHLTGDSPDADFSQFCHRPTLVRHLLRCTLSGQGDTRFRLSTCGGVRLWLDDRLVARFQPFQRNRKQASEITLPLSPEGATLTVELEDLHERDTTCFVSLILAEGREVQAGLPADMETPGLAPILRAMNAVRTDRVFYADGTVSLVCDAPPEAPLALRLTDIGPFPRGGLSQPPQSWPDVAFTLSADAPSAPVLDTATAPQGCVTLTLRTKVGAGEISRRLGTTILARTYPLDPPTLAARKAAALAIIRDESAFDPTVALALLARGQATPRALAILDQALTTIEQRHDCCDFSLLPLLRILRDHAAPLPGETVERLRAAVIGFRYWLDEPGDDVMWFWSENHVACFHICQLVAGAMFPDTTFPNSGKSGAQLRQEATQRLHRWFDSIDAHGLGEWNSAAYYPIDLLALFSLRDMGQDDALARRANALIDRIFVMTGLHTIGGTPAGSQGRAYEKELLAGPGTELGSTAAVAFGGPFVPGFDRAAVMFCLSDYEPPASAAAFAHPPQGQVITARYTQGPDHMGRLTLYKTADAQMSTVSDHKTGQPGHQQHVIDVQCAAHPMARAWINHPGELKEWGERRPSLLAGNGQLPRVAQHGPLALMVYDLPGDTPHPFTQLFAPTEAFDRVEQADDWLLLHSGAARIAIWCSAPLRPVAHGQYRKALWRAQGHRMGWVVTLDPGALPDTRFDPETLTVEARTESGVIRLPFAGPAMENGTPCNFAPLSPLPHVSIDGAPLAPWSGD
ncbi:hypothetical protein [Oceaniglobus trochenteri]|uniref:hypothetical protein n=1 Tax=Oceaniglobus trochenteri TaxID=2763260 RepID=UPI001CFF5E63|nr:hypothetical protein [Oceaniglobus trochenteri]